ncbi:AfsR/SARP family transcriptional regulator [Nocardia sp. NPDC051030]|uniref:AfsR/SARP family transcriptional regulator n=1 Tax=Nocardia sp. NPDC051030 TaxID=3155162 RepID=UPI0034293920
MRDVESEVFIEARMLGPLRLCAPRSAVPSAAKPRTLLALFVLNPGRQFPASSLITELWEDRPPLSAAATLQTYILQLRKLLATATDVTPAVVSESLLRTMNGGYVFTPGDMWLDVHEFHRLSMRADARSRAGRGAEAVEAYRAAEGLWTGSALVDVEQGPVLRAEVARLEQSALSVKERRLAAELRMGYHRAALGDLASLVVQHPFHEGLHAQFMVALYRSGNRTAALDVFHGLRRTMADELGLGLSRNLHELQHAIINADLVPDELAMI